MWHLYPVVIIAAFFLVVITLTAALEKRLVWPYVPEKDAPPESLPAGNPYATQAAAEASEAGFLWAGTFADGKGKLYRIRYNFFVSPTGDVLALVGTGTIASLPLQATWLYTLFADGRSMVTVDHQNAVETDLCGIADGLLAAGFGFSALLAAHRARVAVTTLPIKSLSPSDPLGDFKAYLEHRVGRLCTLGYASFLDPGRRAWRYSLKGAVVLAFRQYFTGLRRAVAPDQIQS